MVEETDDLCRFTALGDEDRDVGLVDDAEVAVHAVGRMKERCGGARRCESRGDLAADESGFADARDDDATVGAGDGLDRAREVFTDTTLGFGERVGFHPQDAASALDNVLVGHRLMRSQMSTARSISGPIAESGSMLGPSLGAQSGSGWVSRKRPCAPAAIADRASTGTYSRAPPLAPSGP